MPTAERLRGEPVAAEIRASFAAASETGEGIEVVGDVEFESTESIAGAITPVLGGVGSVTLAMLVSNVVRAAERRADAEG